MPGPSGAGKAVLTDPNLTAKLRADYEALQNDVQQARELAADFQRQLAGKSNEFAALKRVFQETRSHLERLEVGIRELREERHRLASEAMRAAALDSQLKERDIQLQSRTAEINALRAQLDEYKEKAVESRGLAGWIARRTKR